MYFERTIEDDLNLTSVYCHSNTNKCFICQSVAPFRAE